MFTHNLILMTDSYKASHWKQYPANADGYFGYIESRGGVFSKTVFFGLQIFLKSVLAKPITMQDIDEADAFYAAHGEPFNRAGWEYIVKQYGGYLPVTIKAAPEGSVIPVKNALVTVECNDPRVFWCGSYLETALLRAIWYPTTVATVSWHCKQIITKYLEMSSDNALEQIKFKLHDFGARGASSSETAAIGGAAHLVNFMGSDTVEGVCLMNRCYNGGNMSAFSIPAAEHSTITAWGKEQEVEAYRNMLRQYAKPGALLACVSDSYDIFNACGKLWGEALKQEVVDSGAVLVIRPDSGEPVQTVLEVAEILGRKFGTEVNFKGYKVLNNVRIIQGDGVNLQSIEAICKALVDKGWSIDNIAFGMGGALLQQVNRDTQQFAMKCSAIRQDGKWNDVFKAPATDAGKASKKGRLMLYKSADGYYTSLQGSRNESLEALQTVYKDGRLIKEYSLNEVRNNSERFVIQIGRSSAA